MNRKAKDNLKERKESSTKDENRHEDDVHVYEDDFETFLDDQGKGNTKELGTIDRSSIIKPKQQVKNENVLRSVMKSIGKNKSFLGKQSKNTDDAPRTKKGAGRVSPTFEEEIPIDKDDIQEDREFCQSTTLLSIC